MATVPYVTEGSAWWSAATLNRLLVEFDRRMTLALSGKSPFLLDPYALPVQLAAAGAPNLAGYSAPPNPLYGAVFCFKGAASTPVYLAQTDSWNQAALDASAAAAPEISRNATTRVMVVNAGPLLEHSLVAHTRTDAGTVFYLQDQNVSRPMKRNPYGVAELVCEGLASFDVPLAWNRFSCFRVHNLSPASLTVSTGSGSIIVPAYGCKAFRRDADGYDASLNYGWLARPGRDPRIYTPGVSIGIPELSAAACTCLGPEILLAWLDSYLAAEADPFVALPDASATYAPQWPLVSDASPIHDLMVHRGGIESWGWDAAQQPVKTLGSLTGFANLAADLAPLGVTVTVAGDAVTLSRAAAGAPGLASNGLDLFATGNNLMWAKAGNVSAPGNPTLSVPERQRQFSVLPVTLVEAAPVVTQRMGGDPPAWRLPGLKSNPQTTATLSRFLYGSSSTSSPLPADQGEGYGSQPAAGRAVTAGAIRGGLAGPGGVATPWGLTPRGFVTVWNYEVPLNTSLIAPGQSQPGVDFIGDVSFLGTPELYERWSGGTVSRKAAVRLDSPGWDASSFRPCRERIYAALVPLAGQVNVSGSGDWAGVVSQPDGGPPNSTGKTSVHYSQLSYLSDNVGQLRPDQNHSALGTPDFARYGLVVKADESWSALNDPTPYPHRTEFSAGAPNATATVYSRRPMFSDDYNLVAWRVNAWTRSRPLLTLEHVWLARFTLGGAPAVLQVPRVIGGRIVPAAFEITTAAEKTAWAALLPVKERGDLPGYTAAQASDGRIDVYKATVVEHNTYRPDGLGGRLKDVHKTATAAFDHTENEGGYDPLDPLHLPLVSADYGWISTADLGAFATARSLPWVSVVAGAAQALNEYHWTSAFPAFLDGVAYDFRTGLPHTGPEPPTLTSIVDFGLFRWAGYLNAGDAAATQYVDPNAIAAWNHGVPTLSNNLIEIVATGLPPWSTKLDPYFPAGVAQRLSESVHHYAVRVAAVGLPALDLNSRVLLFQGFARMIANYNVMGGSATGGAWFTTSGLVVQEISGLGVTHISLPNGTERAVIVRSDPFIPLD